MSDIFLCYSKTDVAIANRLAERLQAEGWSVFIDRNTPVGSRWHKQIERELEAAGAVVVLWSARSRESDYVLEEAEYGKRKDILFPALIESIVLPYGFGRIQTANLTDWEDGADHDGLADLLAPLRLHLNGHASGSSTIAVAPQQIITPTLPAPGQTFRDNLKADGEGPLMVVIPAGRFFMGSPEDEPERYEDEGPQHEVQIAQPFAMGVYPVTFDDYDLFCQYTDRTKPGDERWGRESRPVINASWQDAQDYCAWLCEQTECSYRLSSEAEWEYACRAGTPTRYYTGESIAREQANFNRVVGKTTPVGAYPPNPFGLYDMHGNVWEWCQDIWHPDYRDAPADGLSWEAGVRQSRVLRGGSWIGRGRYCRSAHRFHLDPSFRLYNTGFRLARGQ